MEKEGRAGIRSGTCGLERDLDPEFKSCVKIFRQTDLVGEPQQFSLGPKQILCLGSWTLSSCLVTGFL